MSNHIKDGSGETVIDLSDYGEERAAKAAEYVFLQGVFTPPPATNEIKVPDLIFTICEWMSEMELSALCLRSAGLVLTHNTLRCMIPLTAEAALLLLETEELKVFSASPDRMLGNVTIKITLLDCRGLSYSANSMTGIPKGVATGLRSIERSKVEGRTFCVWIALPSLLGLASHAVLLAARTRARDVLQRHFIDSNIRHANVKTSEGIERNTEQFWVVPKRDCTIKQYISVRGVTQNHMEVDAGHGVRTVQNNLSALRFIDVDHFHPAKASVSADVRKMLGIKACCLSTTCIPGRDGKSCGLLDLHYARKKAERGPSELSIAYSQQKAESEGRKRARESATSERSNMAIHHVNAQHARLVAESPGGATCPLFAKGRCSRNHSQHLHGPPETVEARAKQITCRSCLTPGQEHFDMKNQRCPFAGKGSCAYGGHSSLPRDRSYADSYVAALGGAKWRQPSWPAGEKAVASPTVQYQPFVGPARSASDTYAAAMAGGGAQLFPPHPAGAQPPFSSPVDRAFAAAEKELFFPKTEGTGAPAAQFSP